MAAGTSARRTCGASTAARSASRSRCSTSPRGSSRRSSGCEVGGDWVGVLAGAAAMIGHARPVFLGFGKGGKMVATAGGVALALAPLAAAACLVVWLRRLRALALRVARLDRSPRSRSRVARLRLRELVADRRVLGRRRARRDPAPPAQRAAAARGHGAAVLPHRATRRLTASGGATMIRHVRVEGSPARLLRSLGVVAAAVALAAVLADGARAAPWCGTTTTEDRPATVTGRSIRVVYAIPSDGADRSAERAPQISADVDEIAAWWRTQDFEREPRFDRATFACGPQADLIGGSARRERGGAAGQRDAVREARGRARPRPAPVGLRQAPRLLRRACRVRLAVRRGWRYGRRRRASRSSTSRRVRPSRRRSSPRTSCSTRSGRCRRAGLPTPAPTRRGHPCDSSGDILYPYAPAARLAALALDVGPQRLLRAPRRVARRSGLALAPPRDAADPARPDDRGRWLGRGRRARASSARRAARPNGIRARTVVLDALPAEGQRFVRWSGACTGTDSCSLTLGAEQRGHGALRTRAVPAHALRRRSRLRHRHRTCAAASPGASGA